MNILQKLFGGTNVASTQPNPAVARPPVSPAPTPAHDLAKQDRLRAQAFRQEIVGESYYQDALEKICGPRTEAGENRIIEARLILDDKNKHDKNAVRIEILGHTVGHLSREDAITYRARLKREGHAQATLSCQARIKGGWQRGKSDMGHYGVKLDIPPL